MGKFNCKRKLSNILIKNINNNNNKYIKKKILDRFSIIYIIVTAYKLFPSSFGATLVTGIEEYFFSS